MITAPKKRPRDPVQLGKLIVDIATGQTPDTGKDGSLIKPHPIPGKDGCSGPRTRS
jgi:hypothetical protein